MNNDELLSIKEVADILQISTDEVGRLIDQGVIKAEKIGGKRHVWRNDVPAPSHSRLIWVTLSSAAKYVGEPESTLLDMFKKGELRGKKERFEGYLFEFKDLYRYLHFTKKLKPASEEK